MPDKIKDAFEAIKSSDIFLDEQDFREQLTKSPKDVYGLFSSNQQTKDLFLDYSDFENSFDLKKKQNLQQDIPPLGQAFKLGGESTPQLPLTSQSKLAKKPKLNPFTAPIADLAKANKTPLEQQTDLQRKKLSFIEANNKLTQGRINLLPKVKQNKADLDKIQKDLNAIISQSPDGKTLSPELYRQYTELQKLGQAKADELNANVRQLDNSYKASGVLYAGMRNADIATETNKEANFDLGAKTSSAVKQVGNNLVHSGAKIVETIGDLNYHLNEAIGAGALNEKDYENKITDKIGGDLDEYYNNLEKSLNLTLPKSYREYSPTKDKLDLDKLLYFGMNSTAQLAPTVAAGLATGGAGMALTGFTMEFGDAYDTLHKPIKDRYIAEGLTDKEAEKKADLEAGLIAIGTSYIIGQLGKWGAGGLIDAFTKKAIMKKTVADALENMGGKVGKDVALSSIKKSLKDNLILFGKGYFKAVTPETVGEQVEALVVPAATDVYNATTGTDTFKGTSLANKSTWQGAADAGVGALIASSLGGIGSGYKNIAQGSNYDTAMRIQTEDDFETFKTSIQNEVKAGLATPEMAQSAIENVQRIHEADKLIPDTVKGSKKRAEAVALLLEKQDLEKQVEGKDKNLSAPINERISEIDGLLTEVGKGNDIETEHDKELHKENPIELLSETSKEITQEITTEPTPTEDNGVSNAGVEPVSVEEEPTKTNIQNEKTNEVREEPKIRQGEKGNEGGQQSRKENGQETNVQENEVLTEGGVKTPKSEISSTPKEKVSDALKDVESTAKALAADESMFDKLFDKLTDENANKLEKQNLSIEEYNKKIGEFNKSVNSPKKLSEAYHNAKAKPEAQRSASDNELITSVETLLKPKEYATQEAQTAFEGVNLTKGKEFELEGKKFFYHASENKRVGKLKPSTAPQFGRGIYFSTNKKFVEDEFGDKNTTTVSLNIKNPVYTNTKEWNNVEELAIELADKEYGKKKGLTLKEDETYFKYDKNDLSELSEIAPDFISDAAKELGYDAIIDKGSSQYENEIVVLDESKINYPEEQITKPNNKENAIQEPSTREVLQRKQEEVGETGSERKRVESSEQGKETSKESSQKEKVEPKSEISSKPKPENVKAIEEAMTKKSGTIKNEIIKEAADPTEVKKILDNLDSIKSKLAGLTTKDGDSVFSEECKWG